MSLVELRTIQYRKPFAPFIVSIPDGRTFTITAPTQMLVTHRTTVVGIPGPLGENDSFVLLNTQDIAVAEPDDSAPTIVQGM